MNKTIENDLLKVCISEKGAELTSILSKKEKTEFLWQADPAVWGRHAPILFPIVGKLKEDRYAFNGKDYPMSQHGFARDLSFQVIQQEENHLRFSLTDDEETWNHFPFHFRLEIDYRLEGNKLYTGYFVTNLDEAETMYFSIGAHPGLKVPLEEKTVFEDYVIEISPSLDRRLFPVTSEVLINRPEINKTKQAHFPLSREWFKDGVIILETLDEIQVTLKSTKSEKKVVFRYQEMPYLGIWSPYPNTGDFVCIEPWCGIADMVDTNGELTQKEGIHSLAPQAVFERAFEMQFFD